MRNSKTTQILSYAVIGMLLILYVVPLLLVFNVSLKSFNEYLLNPIGIVQN
ncbi:carbohydrate ABC transporter permease, partial [Clostridium perfringens]